MEMLGTIKNVNIDYNNSTVTYEISCNEVSDVSINNLIKLQQKLLKIEIKKNSQKRSLNANAYLWVLLQKMAEKLHTSKDDLYLLMLQRYSKKFTHIILKENAVQEFKNNFRTCVELGEVEVNGKKGIQLQCYYGSSTFDTEEMSVLLEGVVSECEELEIETLTPDEIKILEKEWGYE